jgi:nucleoside-diphosphate-sugar epimerase
VDVTITGGEQPLARSLAAALAGGGRIRLVAGLAAVAEGVETLAGDLRDPEFAARALEGSQALVHLAPLGDSPLEALDRATRGTFVTMEAAAEAGVERVVLGSILALFDQAPASWRISEWWKPRPDASVGKLAPWLAELSTRELARDVLKAPVICLRLGAVSEAPPAGPTLLNWLHPEDAVAALVRALEFDPGRSGWHVYHVTSGGPRLAAAARAPFEFAPRQSVEREALSVEGEESVERSALSVDERTPDLNAQRLTPNAPQRSTLNAQRSPRPRKVVLFGAGGPLAAATARIMAPDYQLRLTDLQPIDEIHRAGKRQSPTAPLPEPLPPPHEMRVVDVTDPDEVNAACEAMEAIINCTVMRYDPVQAFRVNTLGAYNIARAAVKHGIRRVVQTGPQLATLSERAGYWSDYDVPGDAPPRPANHLYGHTKYLGQEILRVFAEYHGLEVPVLLFCMFVNPEEDQRDGVHPFSVSWNDAAYAIRRAVEVPWAAASYQVMNVLADLPHGLFSNQRARDLLGWAPQDTLERFWRMDD